MKTPYHGSRSSSTAEFIHAVAPTYAVISCGKYNSYGHLHEEMLRTLAEDKVLRTDQVGTVVFYSDGVELRYETEHAAIVTATPGATATPSSVLAMIGAAYIGNKNSMKFHNPDCSGVQSMKEKNKVLLESREEAIEKGYVPCGMCQP